MNCAICTDPESNHTTRQHLTAIEEQAQVCFECQGFRVHDEGEMCGECLSCLADHYRPWL